MFSILRIICLLAFLLAVNQSGFCSESDNEVSIVSGDANGDTSRVGDLNQSSGSAEPEVVTKPRVPHQNSDFIKMANNPRNDSISKVEPPPKPQAKPSANNKSSNSKPTQKKSNNPVTKNSSREANDLSQQGVSVYQKRDYAKARELFERALAIREKVLGPEHPSTATSLNNLASTYKKMHDYAKARELHERALAIREKVLGPEHPDTATSLDNLADTYCKPFSFDIKEQYITMSDRANAEELHKRALAIREKVLGPEHPHTATSLKNLADTHVVMGAFSKARELYERALAIREKVYGQQHFITSQSLYDLAYVCIELGDYDKARELEARAVAIQGAGLDGARLIISGSFRSRAFDYERKGDYAKAREFHEYTLAIYEKALGPQHPSTATSLNDLARTYSNMGDNTKARGLQERALAIYEKALGDRNFDIAQTLRNLTRTRLLIGDLGSARSSASRAAAGIDRLLQSALSMDEKYRLSWQKQNLSMDLFASVMRPEQIAQLSIRWKGVVLDSLVEDRSLTMAFSKNENSSKVLRELQGLRTQLAEILFHPDKKEEADKISEKIGAIQRSMASLSTRFGRVRASADLTVDTILPALSGGSVFVDFFEFNDPKLKGDERLHYGAILIAEDGTPVFIRIPDRIAIDSAADAIRAAVKNGDEQSLQDNLATLSKKLWQPVAEKLPAETKRIIVSPDGKLSFISFAALMDGDGKFICEKYLISYVASGRDLAKQDAAKENKSITLFANPKFDLNSTKKIGDRLAMRSSEISAFGNIQLPPLLGTEEECKALKQAAISTGWNPTTYVGAEATEQQIRSVKNTGILHLATHGFYLNAFTPAKDDTRGMSITPVEDSPKPQAQNGADPMRASGIALSGAQNTIKEWSKGKCPDPENDGILTAEEVAGLNLDGTWIVTLSACETGIGEARSGEGVFGLRRAFMMAGSKNLIMTLWAVNDASTAEIMADFYKRCFASSDASRSLAETQRDWLLKIKKDKGLLAAVRDAGPFVIATTGKP
jgi:CHAT domain-containing protein/Tfp pilus assembly protein PilF